MVSKKLQSKISKTRKRLSDERWLSYPPTIVIIVLLALGFVGFRLTGQPFAYSVVRADIPLLSVPTNDRSYHTYEEKPAQEIDDQVTTIVLDQTGNLYFGELNAFGKNYHDVRNKFIVRSEQNAPQTGTLLQQIMHWRATQKRKTIDPTENIAVFIPASTIPMPVVIQVLADIRYSEQFDRVILGGGLL